MATFDQFIASLEQDFGEQGKGKPFEVFCKWFLENDPEWSKTVDKVWLWDDYPNKWQRQDLGTDLVFRDNEGLIWAVQAKCYGEHRTTTKGDMNSFLADTGRKAVDRRLWMQTTNKMEAKAEKTLKGQDKPVTVFMLNDFRDAQLEYPSSFAELHQAKVKDKPTPDPHQIKAIADATSGLKTSDRGQMIMACGTGKTFTTLWIKEALESHNTLVLLPSLSLLSQTMREWAWAGNTDFDILNVCSDKSVGKKTEDMDPADAPFPVTSEVEAITKFLKQPKPKVIFCTYQSSELIAEAQLDKTVPDFDLAVADEAHRCAGKADAKFATILDADKIRTSKRLFTTATPRYFSNARKDAGKARGLGEIGMDDEAVFGPVIHKLTFGQAIYYEPEPLLNDYQVVIVGVDEPMVREWIVNYEIVSIDPDNQTDARTLAAKIGLLKAVKDYDLKRVISFHSRVAGAKQFSDELVDIANLIEPANRPEGTFLSDYVSGAMKAGDRKEKIDRLKVLEGYDRGILTNARCLAEGVDVPSLDGVAFIDPKGSQVEIIQAVGRAIRKVRGAAVQKKGTIVLPVFIEDGDDHEASIEASNFKPVWDVLKALRSHDEVLADTLDEYRTNMAKNASQSRETISDKIIFDLPVSVDAQFSSALRTVLVESSTASWEFWFGILELFKQTEGHCKVPHGYKLNGFKLGSWVGNQRTKQYSMPPERKQQLDDMGFAWDAYAAAWAEGFSKLLQFKQTEGHCKVPHGYKLNGFKLGSWVRNQRTIQYTLPPERKQQLDDIGFIWDLKAEAWEKGFSKLLQFKEAEGHCKVSQTFKVDGFDLGTWVTRKRTFQDTLPPERKQQLDDIGFIWDLKAEAWEKGFSKLLQFEKVKGHCLVPYRLKLDGFNLGKWVGNQRSSPESMTPERKQRLDDIGFVWSSTSVYWEEGFTKLLQFKKLEGHCRVPTRFEIEGFKLGSWVRTQRATQDSMSKERKQRLNDIGVMSDRFTEAWEEGFSKLLNFKETEGHCRVPKTFELEGYKLGRWVSTQRNNQDGLPPERRQRLDDIGFIWDTKKGRT
jgi:superfamily II DNA or RNA helicase